MNALLLADLSFGDGWIGLLVKLGIAAIVIWAVVAILKAMGVTFHPVVRIIAIALISIVALLVLVKVITMLL